MEEIESRQKGKEKEEDGKSGQDSKGYSGGL